MFELRICNNVNLLSLLVHSLIDLIVHYEAARIGLGHIGPTYRPVGLKEQLAKVHNPDTFAHYSLPFCCT